MLLADVMLIVLIVLVVLFCVPTTGIEPVTPGFGSRPSIR